uniref:Uncharacterized protein n=1 Tax=Anguilla anguilla TaxID=7936 RepID=A0A0E9UV58_ANGAN
MFKNKNKQQMFKTRFLLLYILNTFSLIVLQQH